MGSRQDLRTLLRSVLGSGVNVYDHPPDNLKSPAVVITAAEPWIMPADMAGPQRRYRMTYDLQVMVSRAKPANSYNKLEKIVFDLFDGVLNERWKAMEASAPVDEQVGEVTYATTNVAVMARLEGKP